MTMATIATTVATAQQLSYPKAFKASDLRRRGHATCPDG